MNLPTFDGRAWAFWVAAKSCLNFVMVEVSARSCPCLRIERLIEDVLGLGYGIQVKGELWVGCSCGSICRNAGIMTGSFTRYPLTGELLYLMKHDFGFNCYLPMTRSISRATSLSNVGILPDDLNLPYLLNFRAGCEERGGACMCCIRLKTQFVFRKKRKIAAIIPRNVIKMGSITKR